MYISNKRLDVGLGALGHYLYSVVLSIPYITCDTDDLALARTAYRNPTPYTVPLTLLVVRSTLQFLLFTAIYFATSNYG